MDARDILQIKPAETIEEFRPGDTVIVNVRIREGNRERVQAYQGNVIVGSHRKDRVPQPGATFTVRRVSYGVGVERIFPALLPDDRVREGHSPRQGPTGQALLPAGPHRPQGSHQRATLILRGVIAPSCPPTRSHAVVALPF